MISNFSSPPDAAFWSWYKHIQYFGRLAAAKFTQDVTAHKAEVTLSDLILQQQDTKAPHFDALGYCGAMQNDRLYPDPHGMGYPFNREWTQHIAEGTTPNISSIISDNLK